MRLNALFENRREEREETRTRNPIALPQNQESPLPNSQQLTDPSHIVGSIPYMSPERLHPRGRGAPSIETPLPPFPYHPKGNAVKDPETQIYWILKSEGPLSWHNMWHKITPYLKQFKSAERDAPSRGDYSSAVLSLLKRKVIHRVKGNKYAIL